MDKKPCRQVIVTYDSCRYDTFMAAKNRPKIVDRIYQAYSHSTMTGPSHWTLFMGYLPHVFEPLPFYNRAIKSIWKLQGDESHYPLYDFDSNRSIIHGLKKIGYYCISLTSRAWFNNEFLQEDFDFFKNTGTDSKLQIKLASNQICNKARFFLFINFGETHIPYSYQNDHCHRKNGPQREMSEMEFNELSKGYKFPQGINRTEGRRLWLQQVKCCEFINGCLTKLLCCIKKPFMLIITADHGDCFGEVNPHGSYPRELWGHGFFHPKVLEVPLFIKFIDNDIGVTK